ncbi:MAG: PKD-like domain-containing protein, partial [Bacteroidota bacterium]
GRLFNLTNVTRTATYIVTPRAITGSCEGNPFTLTVFVNPTPVISAMSTVTCSGIPFLISPTDQVNGIVPQSTQYTWDPPTYSNVSLTGGNSGTSIGQVIGTLINATNVLQSATYVITPRTSSNCIGTPFTAVVYVESKSKITEMSTTVCSGIQFRVTPVNETNGIVPLGTKYTWVLPVMGNASLTGGESISVPQEDIFGTLYNATNKVQTAVYIITPGSESCGSSNQFTLTVYVNSTPQISAMSTVVCSGVTFVVSPVNQTNGIVPDGTNYSWNIPSVSSTSLTGGQSGSGLYVTGTLLNFTNTPKSATYQVEPIAPAGSCKGGLFTVTVIVNPGAYITEMSTTVCSGVQFDISPRNGVNGIVPDLTTYNWDIPTLSTSLTGGESNSGKPSIFGKLTNSSNVTRTAVYTVVPNVQSCETYSSFTLTVYVNPTPKISEMSTVVCSGLQFEVSPTNGGTEIVPVTTRYAWEIPAVSTTSLVGGQSDSGRMSVTGILTNNTNTTRTA